MANSWQATLDFSLFSFDMEIQLARIRGQSNSGIKEQREICSLLAAIESSTTSRDPIAYLGSLVGVLGSVTLEASYLLSIILPL